LTLLESKPVAGGDAMEVKTFTYKKMLNSYYLQKFISSQKMEEHIAEMLQQGWDILSGEHLMARVR
jgi:hypothetical protein